MAKNLTLFTDEIAKEENEYDSFLQIIKEQIQTAQLDAALAVSRRLILLYWQIGSEIRKRQLAQGWGAKIVEKLSSDLRIAFPGVEGFSRTNFLYARSFAEAYPVTVGDKNYFLDLLFYHVRLRCYVIIDLKMTAFEPEYAGKMNFYLSATDDLLRHAHDEPSIGIILCKERDKVTAEYALNRMTAPIGVSSFTTTRDLPESLAANLPSVAQLEAELRASGDYLGTVSQAESDRADV